MTQEELIKKFCPDYEKKLEEQVPPQEFLLPAMFLTYQFVYNVFEETLQSFADRICDRLKDDIFEKLSHVCECEIHDIIDKVPTPDLSDLWK